MTQSLSGGTPASARYPSLGGTTGVDKLPPGRVLSLLLGFPHTGKTCLVESHPGAWIIRTDLVTTSNPDPQAVVWPGYNDAGQCFEDGQAFTLTWDRVLQKVEKLVELASSGQPRPETVVFDSLTSTLDLVKKWAPENLFASTRGKQWHQLDGKMAWTFCYDKIVETVRRLRAVGYGVCVTAHLRHADIKSGDEVIGTKIDVDMTDAFFRRLFPYFELIASISRDEYFKTVPQPAKTTVIKGKTVSRPQPDKKVKASRYTLGFEITDLKDRYKGKARPVVELPHTGGWAAFTTAYMASVDEVYDAATAETHNHE